MIGGKVVETILLPERDRVWVNCRDTTYGDECAIYVEWTAEARAISEGDDIWWHGRSAFWTPRNHAFIDRRLTRIGCSGVRRPR